MTVASTGMCHSLKTWPKSFQAMWIGKKTHEVRSCKDRNFNVGDLLSLEEWEPDSKTYTGRAIEAEVVYVTEGGSFGLPTDMCVMSVSPKACISRKASLLKLNEGKEDEEG